MRVLLTAAMGGALALAACGGEGEGEAKGGGAAASGPTSQAGAAALANDTLRVRPGLWRTTQREAGGEPRTAEECITPDEAAMDASDFAEIPEGCTQNASRQGGAFVYRTSCPTGQGLPPAETEMRSGRRGTPATPAASPSP